MDSVFCTGFMNKKSMGRRVKGRWNGGQNGAWDGRMECA